MRIPIPQVLTGVLVARQASLLPSTFCSPECPSCRDDVANFDGLTTSCTANSSFIQNCGHCQTCIMTYAIENGGIDSQSQLELIMKNILNMCENTTVSGEIEALQSQASLESALGAELATTTDPALSSMTGSYTMAITKAPTTTPTSDSYTGTPAWMTMSGGEDNTSWQSILATASWASYYYAHKSAESASLASVSAELAKQTTTSSSPKSTQSAAPVPINPNWVAGPVVGSVMGICTVITVIFFTRRRHRKEQMKVVEKMVETIVKKEFHDLDNDSRTNGSVTQSPAPPATAHPEKAQLHAETAPVIEVENTEVHELPAVEPVGSELNTPMEARMREEDWPVSPLGPLPLSPLPLLFAMSEMRDQRKGDVSPRHDTFYHP